MRPMPAVLTAVRCCTVCCLAIFLMVRALPALDVAPGFKPDEGNVIFIHPDGTSLAHWGAARITWKGPDGLLEWDTLPAMAVYRGHMRDSLTGTSHGGATVHAYGIKVKADSFGMNGRDPLTSLSGRPYSIMTEARKAGKAIGVVNSGDLVEPGTACFLASVERRGMGNEIARQIMASEADVILAGGEQWLLPLGEEGRHGAGVRPDGLNLVKQAEETGYTVVYNAAELKAVPPETRKLLGIFAATHSFHDKPEEALRKESLPLYKAGAPTVAEMLTAALKILSADPEGFLLVVEEEGSDNFSNVNHAAGALEAMRRADAAIGVAKEFLVDHPDTLLITAADSDASGMQVIGCYPGHPAYVGPDDSLPGSLEEHTAPIDGVDGPETKAFLSAPDRNGRRHPFAIAWASYGDTAGGILCRADGLNHELLRGTIDNTDIYRIMYATLFGKLPD